MRSYIFTERERVLVQAFLKGDLRAKDRVFHVLASRVRRFNRLAGDVDLFLELRRRLAESEAAVSA